MNPLLIAALLSGVGGLANWKIQDDAISAQNAENQRAMMREGEMRNAERLRQRNMETLQADEVARALLAADPAQTAEDVTADVEAPENAIVQAAADYNVPELQGQSADGPLAGDIGRLVADKLKQTRGILKGQATLSGQGSALQGTQDDLARMAGVLQNVGSDRRGSLAASRLETNVTPARVTPSSSPIGDLLMLGGQLYGGMGGFGSLIGSNAPLAASGTAGALGVSPNIASAALFGGLKPPPYYGV